ncbi:uncharacterized protein LOC126681921 [Mercurialis annua]|uniref:uncharacterized protein LOC126681921 n=1 Tax=Mercurialis annua TaxID=3986 RepID=UPI00215EA86A|nr:uncharacterized protein LOC126681921 [Mercurialis annua]
MNQKKTAPKLFLQLWQFKLSREVHSHSKVDTRMSYDIISEIKSTLNASELEMFRNQIVQLNKSELWFEVGGCRLKFGIEEFALVSGLNCQGDSSKYGYPKVANGLYDKYFSGLQSVSKQTLQDLFLSRRWDSEEDGFKLAFMHFLHNFLLASPKTARIPLKDFDVVDSADFNDYLWGVDVFKCTFDSLATKAVLTPGCLKAEDNAYHYRLNGFPYVLQCWFYECCLAAKKTFVQLVNKTAIPRILRWQAFFHPKYIPVDRELFVEFASDQVFFRSIVPTPAEKNALPLGDFFKKNKDKGKAVNDSNVSQVGGNEDGYCPAFDISNASESITQTLDLSKMEKKLQVLMVGQKTMQADILEFKRVFTSKFSEVLTVVNSLNAMLTDIVDSKKDKVDDSNVDASSSRDGSEHEDDSKSSSIEPEEKNADLPAKKNSSIGTEGGVEDSVDAQKVTHTDEIDPKSYSVKENKEGESSDEEESNEKIEEVGEPSDGEESDEKSEDVGESSCEEDGSKKMEDADLVDEKAGDWTDITDNVPNEKNMEADVVIASTAKVPRESKAISISPTCTLTEEMCDEAEKKAYESIAKLKSKEIDYIEANFSTVSINPDVVTPVPSKRIVKPSFLMKSPFLNEFGSSSGCIMPKPSNGSVCLCPFDGNCIFLVMSLNKILFGNGWQKAILKAPGRKYTIQRLTYCVPVFVLAWLTLTQKHVDILLYYLRKKIKNGRGANKRCTTTDNFFDRRIQAIYALYLKKQDTSLVSSKNTAAEYIYGGHMRCNTKWADVDDVLFPINCGKDWHWILARLNFKERCIYVYNSLRSVRSDSSAIEIVNCYSVLLPLFLEDVNFFESRDDIDTTSGPYEGKSITDPFRIEIVQNLPIQTDTDCGVHMFAAAEFFVDGKVMRQDFSAEEHRARYASSLYFYGRWKYESSVLSENEAPLKIKRVTS